MSHISDLRIWGFLPTSKYARQPVVRKTDGTYIDSEKYSTDPRKKEPRRARKFNQRKPFGGLFK